jgi:hypothetical protein
MLQKCSFDDTQQQIILAENIVFMTTFILINYMTEISLEFVFKLPF